MLQKKRKTLITLLVVALVAASPFVLMAVYVDDWSRDLTTNRAHTAVGAPAEPWRFDAADAEAVADAVAAIADAEPAWQLANDKPLPDDSPLAADEATHHLVRTTGLMGYRDDIWLVVLPRDDGVTVLGESRSRVGKGDLGQNPRNLVEIGRLLAAELGG